MSAYGSFSAVYDLLMSDFDYATAAEYLVSLARKHGSTLSKPLDLACGRGRLAAELTNLGYDPVCVDGSHEILSLAKARLPKETLILCQDMTELDLNDTVDTCFCTMDSINYITTKSALKATFKRLAIFTEKDGLFIFDTDSEFKFSSALANNIYTYDLDNLYLVWHTEYSKRSHKSTYELTWFCKEGNNWFRYDDNQEQRFWSQAELIELLDQVGFEFVAAYDAYTEAPPSKTSDRIHYVFRRK